MSEFTPGPWRVGDAGHTIFGRPCGIPPKIIAMLQARSPERHANARLIAAAPDLLAVAYDLVDVISSWRENYPDIHAEELNAAWVAINKVTNN